MKGDKIPDRDNIARFCRPWQAPGGEIQATAFMLRANDDEELSVNWLEFLKCSSREGEIREIQEIYSKTFSVSKNARIAVLNVGEMRDIVRTESLDNRNIEVIHNPIPDGDQSHSGVYNLKQDNELIAELILEVVRENYPAREK
ncbi:hypothetical protein JW935_19680 [candidate division KSB1 bacterium]|nr:hypothetical protein [candidate division KSB1 bacterium]